MPYHHIHKLRKITADSKFQSQLKTAMKKKKGSIALIQTALPSRESQELSQHDWECNAQKRANMTAVDTYQRRLPWKSVQPVQITAFVFKYSVHFT